MGKSPKKRLTKIYSRNKKNHNKRMDMIKKNHQVLKDLGYHKIIKAEEKTKV